ncbi:MAG TPA: ROK family protein, partial [Trebonia sp.]
RPCRCGSRGCLEAYVGAEAILDQYGGPLPGGQETALAAMIDLAATSGPAVAERAAAAEQAVAWGQAAASEEAAEVLQRTALYLGDGIANLINLFNPERIILGGWAGLLLGEHMLPAIRAAARDRSLRHLFAGTSIELGRLGPDAVALGAATLPIGAFLGGSVFTGRESGGPVG